MWKARDLIRRFLLGGEPAAASEQVAALAALPWAAVAGAAEMAQRLELLAAIIELMPPIRGARRAGPDQDAASPRRRGRRTTSPPSTPCGFRPSIIRCEAIRRWSSCTPAKGPTRPSTSGPPRPLAGATS